MGLPVRSEIDYRWGLAFIGEYRLEVLSRIATGNAHQREMTDAYAAEFPSFSRNGDGGRNAAIMPTLAQTPSAAGPADSEKHSAASILDFSRIWTHPAFPWFEPPASGPGPVTNLSRWAGQGPAGPGGSLALPAGKVGISNYDQLVGDHKSPILQPWAAEVIKKFGEMSLAGISFPNPSNQCWPAPTPFIYKLHDDAYDPAAGQDHDLV